jgi:hypothetical protein
LPRIEELEEVFAICLGGDFRGDWEGINGKSTPEKPFKFSPIFKEIYVIK